MSNPKTWPCMFNTLNDAYSQQYAHMGMLLVCSSKYPEKAGLNQWVFNHTVQNISNLLYSATDPIYQWETQGNAFGFILPIIRGYNAVNAVEPSTVLPQSKLFGCNGLVDI